MNSLCISGQGAAGRLRAQDPSERADLPCAQYHPTWARETPQGVREPLPENTDWHRYAWTVPPVDTIQTLGIEVYSVTDQPLIVWLGTVTW